MVTNTKVLIVEQGGVDLEEACEYELKGTNLEFETPVGWTATDLHNAILESITKLDINGRVEVATDPAADYIIFYDATDGLNKKRLISSLKTDVSLNNVDNTSDVDKPVSTAQQTALNLKYDNTNPSSYLNETSHDALAADNPHSVTKTQVGLSNVPNTDFTAAVGLNTAKVSADGSIDTHSDVDVTTSTPNIGDRLIWDGSNFVPDPCGVVDLEATNAVTTTRTANTYALMSGMTLTPPAGTYRVFFFGSVANSDGTSINSYAVFSAGTIVSDSERDFTLADKKQSDMGVPVGTTAKVTVNGSQAIEIQWKEDGNGTLSSFKRSLVLHKVVS